MSIARPAAAKPSSVATFSITRIANNWFKVMFLLLIISDLEMIHVYFTHLFSKSELLKLNHRRDGVRLLAETARFPARHRATGIEISPIRSSIYGTHTTFRYCNRPQHDACRPGHGRR